MRGLIDRNVTAIDQRLVVLAPPHQEVPDLLTNTLFDPPRHTALVHDVQRLRGTVYCTDGALRPEHLTVSGRHQIPEDHRSWHLLLLDKEGQISSCAWYLLHNHAQSVEALRVRSCPLNGSPEWRETFRAAVDNELERAYLNNLKYAELGGWAISPRSRGTTDALLMALATYSLSRFLGGALGLTTATVRHGSSTILRRLGGSDVEINGSTVPKYYDPHYMCDMELLRFDSRQPNHKYATLVDQMSDRFADVLVISRQYNERRKPLVSYDELFAA